MKWKLWWMIIPFTFIANLWAKKPVSELSLAGLPLQLAWADINNDKRLDLQALMLVSHTIGDIDTYFEGGDLRGLYEDVTQKEKYFVTVLQTEDGWQETEKIELGEVQILGFVTEPNQPAALNIWTQEGLKRYRWDEAGWKDFAFGKTPGLLATAPTTLSKFTFWHQTPQGTFWTIPDLAGIHILEPDKDFQGRFIPYPSHALQSNRVGQLYHSQGFALPSMLNLDGQLGEEILFQGDEEASAYAMTTGKHLAHAKFEGTLMDLDGDGFPDRLVIKENEDIDRLKDLPKVTSNLTVYRATGPLTFEKEPTTQQDLAGFLIQNNDSDIQLAPPFSDINNDGRLDIAGIALKMGVWQIAKLVSMGRLKIQFLLHLHVQNPDGTFRTLANGPFKMDWKINIRKLKLPEFAQIAADYTGDGWWDILQVGDSKLTLTSITDEGFQLAKAQTLKIPRGFRETDQAYGRDLDLDGRAEIILVKLGNQETKIAVMGVSL